jgi:hypothetical protein
MIMNVGRASVRRKLPRSSAEHTDLGSARFQRAFRDILPRSPADWKPAEARKMHALPSGCAPQRGLRSER